MSGSTEGDKAFAALRRACAKLAFQPHDVPRRLDERGHHDLALDSEFPFHIALFRFDAARYVTGWSWHERLEVTFPLDRSARMRMGEESVALDPGDILLVDNLKLHNYEYSPDFNTRSITISFASGFVYHPGSPACDYIFLLPFLAKRDGHPHVLRRADDLAPGVYADLQELLRCYFSNSVPHHRAACKAVFLRILYAFACRFATAEMLRAEFVKRREQTGRFARLFDYVAVNYPERINVPLAAKLVSMSPASFMKHFRSVSGMTFMSYLTRVRLGHAQRLLRETERTIADIASSVGFSDQSYFDRRFKAAFGKSPRQFRAESIGLKSPLPRPR